MLRKFQFIGSIIALYAITIGSIGTLLYSSQMMSTPAQAATNLQPVSSRPVVNVPSAITGKPIRIVIPDRNIDLAVQDGTYDYSTGSWTLSDTNAQFLTSTSLANDQNGTTFIYGHGTDQVFGRIGNSPPAIGAKAEIIADNQRVFSYELESIQNLKPKDTWILNNSQTGKPRLIVQTCTGMFSEWRTMFIFSFKEVA